MLLSSSVVATATAQMKPEYAYQDFVNRVMVLQNRITWSDKEADFSDFDLDEYVATFNLLTLRAPGMRPVSDHTGRDGHARVYLLADSINFDSFKQKWKNKLGLEPDAFVKMGEFVGNNQLSQKLQAADSPEGYFQLIVWREFGERQLALHWHANYGKAFLVCTKEALMGKLGELEEDWAWKLTNKQRKAIKQIDPAPVVSVERDRCTVRITVIAPFGGICMETYTISRGFPHIVENTRSENLFYYRPMLMF
jgi:hypothetical protein